MEAEAVSHGRSASMTMRTHGSRLFLGLVSMIGAVGLSAAFVPVASAQVTPPESTVPIGGNGSTITNVTINGGQTTLGVFAPNTPFTFGAKLTLGSGVSPGTIYIVDVGFAPSASPFSSPSCLVASGVGSASTKTWNVTSPSTAGIYDVGAFMGPFYAFQCGSAWVPNSSGATIATIVVTSFSSDCLLAQSYTATTDPGVGAGLCDKLVAAQDAANRGNTKAEANILGAFDNLVAAQTGKALTTEQADTLTTLVYYLMPTS